MNKVSIIIPTYNNSQYILRALQSVFSQTFTDYEILVIDDGSTDNTRGLLKPYISKIHYMYQKNKGPASARNLGIEQSSGLFIAFLDADDEWLEDKLQKQISLFRVHQKLGLIFTDMKHVVNGDIVYESYLKDNNYKYVSEGMIYEKLLKENFIFTPTVLVKKECLDTVGLFREDLRIGEDFDLWLKISKRFPIGIIPESLVIRHRHSVNVTHNRILYSKSLIKIYKEQLKDNKNNLVTINIIKKQLEKLYFALGYHSFRKKDWRVSRKAFSKCLQIDKSIKVLLYVLLSAYMVLVDNIMCRIKKNRV